MYACQRSLILGLYYIFTFCFSPHVENLSREECRVDLKVLLFAGAREISGISEGRLRNVPANCSHKQLLERVIGTFGLEKMADCIALALNQNYVAEEDNLVLKEGDELAVIPPLSGGKS